MTSEKYAEIYNERVRATFSSDPLVPIELKGNTYSLEFNNKTVKELYKTTGVNLLESSFTKEQMQNPGILGIILYWALNTNHPDLTPDDVDKLFTLRHLPGILNRIRLAVDLFMPDMSDCVPTGVLTAKAKEEVAESEDPLERPVPFGSGTGR